MKLIADGNGPALGGIEVPQEFYWVSAEPVRLAGMEFPREDFPWAALAEAGFSRIVALEPGDYDPQPLRVVYREKLEDLSHRRPPADQEAERVKVTAAVRATVGELRLNRGVVVHCLGGRGRTGTVLGCVLREFGHEVGQVLAYLDELHKARGKEGWPESPWQSEMVEAWHPERNLFYRNNPVGDSLVFAAPYEAEYIAQIWRALETARTWGEFRTLMPPDEYDDLVQYVLPEAEYLSRIPADDDAFDSGSIPGHSDGDYPLWLQQQMHQVLPASVLEKYAKVVTTVLNGDTWEIPLAAESNLLADLESLGYTPIRRDDLGFF